MLRRAGGIAGRGPAGLSRVLGAVGGAAVLSGGMLVVGGAAPAQAQGQAAYSFVANTGADSVTEYAMGASGNETPVATISGSATGLDGPEGVAVDSAGHLFVANINVDSVTEYAKGATGNTAPVATISGSATRLSRPWAWRWIPRGTCS